MGEKLNETQIAALRWGAGTGSRAWSGVRYGSPPKATINSMIRRGFMAKVGEKSMDLYRTTDAGRAALPPTENGDTRPDRSQP